jgi:hypothetical protein
MPITILRILRLACFALATMAAGIVLSAPGFAADETPDAFVNSIYAQYSGDSEQAGILLDSDAAIHRYFEPSLAAIIIADNAKAGKSSEAPALDGDPFVDSQEWNISSFAIDVHRDGADKANAEVSFTNFDKPMKLKLFLVHLPEGWRIADIALNGDEGTLRGLYAKK